ncbi:glycoside hydrolase family 16 protein [Ephemerocybe angulata]|uniref:Glycoside hydrolase family 16 protein n=1 Tax=Ephemerocybe angulata TaxID=980116 RepID=A0A8H6MBV4_9AGAR|nr:glycoside hydrolase family 16 protein [Tulosesus angulatus]
MNLNSRAKLSALLLTLIAYYTAAVGALTYSLSETIIGPAFYDKFIWRSGQDPSHGRVNYTSKDVSQKLNLTFATPDTFILRADYKTVLDPAGPGRNSVRIRSNASYTTHVAIFDVRHMPQGCGYGEVDIVEGVHSKPPNLATLHTTAGCTMPANRSHTGSSASNNCEGGCNVKFPSNQSFGLAFNDNGGGWFALERTATYIKLWFWPRKGGAVPSYILSPKTTLDPGTWYFSDNHIINNLTFCGDWAGPAYASSGCSLTCTEFVNQNTDYFKNAYFDIAAVRIYKE